MISFVLSLPSSRILNLSALLSYNTPRPDVEELNFTSSLNVETPATTSPRNEPSIP